MGGTSRIETIDWRDGVLRVNGAKHVIPIDTPDGFGAAAFEQGSVMRALTRGELPPRTRVHDAFAAASGAFCWELELAPGSAREVELAVPFGTAAFAADAVRSAARARPLASVARTWSEQLGQVEIRLGSAAPDVVDTLRTATAHILVNRDGVALQPGPRRYTRSWIRDGATMSAALLRMGQAPAVRDFAALVRAYQARRQRAVRGRPQRRRLAARARQPRPARVHRRRVLAHDRRSELAAELWPVVLRATRYLESLRAQRLAGVPAWRAACVLRPAARVGEPRGLYLAHPVHAYWDDFWALRGLGDAAELAHALGDRGRRSGCAR
jgi:hypothetical protein